MLKLIRNDVTLNAFMLVLVFMLMNLGLVLSVTGRQFLHRFAGLHVGFGYAIVFPLVVFLREAYYEGQILSRSLPLPPLHVVLAKYCSFSLLAVPAIGYGWLYQALLESVVGHMSKIYLAQQMEAGYAVEHSLLARGLGLVTLLSVAVPLIIRFGTFWRIVMGFFVVQVIWSSFIDILLALSLKSMFFFGMPRCVFFASLIAIALLATSVRVSVWLYGQREF
jgi:hypothetical protein